MVFDILDGYHRTYGLGLVTDDPNPVIKSHVLYGCSDEEMYDQRILAANSVKSVKYARLAYWMKGAWRETPWFEKLSVAQAFNLTLNDLSGNNRNLSPDESAQIKAWVTAKAHKWLSTVGTIYQNLRVVEAADPKLVMRVRSGSFGKGQLAITPAQLEAITSAFPLEYGLQNKIAIFANSHAISSARLYLLVEELKEVDINDEAAVEKVFLSGNWQSVLRRTEKDNTRSKSGKGKNTKRAPKPEVAQERDFLEGKALIRKNRKLKEELASAQKTIAGLKVQLKNALKDKWWMIVPNLSEQERSLLDNVFSHNLSLEESAQKMGIMEMKVVGLLRSAIRKYQIYKTDLNVV